MNAIRNHPYLFGVAASAFYMMACWGVAVLLKRPFIVVVGLIALILLWARFLSLFQATAFF